MNNKRIIKRETGEVTEVPIAKPKAVKPDGLRASKPLAKKAERMCEYCNVHMFFSPIDNVWRCKQCGNMESPQVDNTGYEDQSTVIEANDWVLVMIEDVKNNVAKCAMYSSDKNVMVSLPNVLELHGPDSLHGRAASVTIEFDLVRMVRDNG